MYNKYLHQQRFVVRPIVVGSWRYQTLTFPDIAGEIRVDRGRIVNLNQGMKVIVIN